MPPLRHAVDRLAHGVRAFRLHQHHAFDFVVEVIERVAVRFHADGVDADVGADAAGEVEQSFVDVLVMDIDRDRAGRREPSADVLALSTRHRSR